MSKPSQKILSAQKLQELTLREAAQQGELATVKTLIAQRVNVNASGPGSQKTALHWAAKYKHYKIVDVLLNAGADQSLKDKEGFTPLAIAEKIKENDAIIERLQSQFVLNSKDEKEKMDKVMQEVKPKIVDEKIIRASMDRLERHLLKNRSECYSILSAYIEQVHTCAKSIYPDRAAKKSAASITNSQDIWSYALSFIIPSLGNKPSDCPNEALSKQVDMKQKLELDVLIKHHFSSIEAVFSLVNQPDQFDKFMKKVDSKITSVKQVSFENKITIMMAELIVRQVRFLRKLKFETKSKGEYLKILLADDKQTLKLLRKKLKGFVLKAGDSLTELKTIMRENFSEYLVNPLGFFNFLETYFDGNALDRFEHADKSKHYGITDPKQLIEALQKSSLQYKSDILIRFKKYLAETRDTIYKILTEKNKSAVHLSLMQGGDESENELAKKSFIKEIESIVQETIAINIQNFDKSFTCTSDYLYGMYKLGQGLLIVANDIFSNIDTFSTEHLKSTAQMIRKQFLENLGSNSNRFESDFEAIRLKEKQFSKEKENQKREKESEEKMKLAAILHQKKISDEKFSAETKEKNAWIEKIFCKLLLPKKDEVMLEQIKSILNNTLGEMSKTEFYALIIKLEIEGYEKIQAQKMIATNNKLTLNVGKFYSFTLHERHHKDNIDNVDPGTIQDLRKMFDAIGIKKDNWIELIKSYVDMYKSSQCKV